MNAVPKTPAPRPSKKQRSPEFVRTAKALLLRQRTREAINLLRRGLNLDPSCNQAALLLSKCLVAAKRLREARLTLDKLLDREETAGAHLLLVRVCTAQGDHAAALESARRGLASFPEEQALRDLQDQARLELADLLDDTTERNEDRAVDPEDLPTAETPEGAPFGGLLAEAGASDTVQVAGTALTLPPVPEELATSPNYRQAEDGALEDPLVIESEDDLSDRTPTPLPSDELDFDHAPGAPDMISAVKGLVDGDKTAQDAAASPGPFHRLLRHGPPAPGSRPPVRLRVLPPLEDEVDPDEVGGPTPADTPGAKQKERRLRFTPRAASMDPDDPTLDLRSKARPTKQREKERPRLVPVDPPVDGGAGIKPADPPVDGGAGIKPADLPVDGGAGIKPATPSVAVRTKSSLRVPASSTEPIAVIDEGSLLSRWWPLWLTIALLVIASSTVAGLIVRQRARVSRNLDRARMLATKHQVKPLKVALHHIRAAANLGGRRPEMVALAAAIHAELAYEFGESTARGAAALVEESTRLEADRLPAATQDLAVARAYLQLSQHPLPEALGHLLRATEQHPRHMHLRLLYSQALMKNGELDLARKVIDELPADDLGVLKARARLYWKSGHPGLATRLLRLAATLGLAEEIVEVELARFETLGGQGTPQTLRRLERTIDHGKLPRTPLAWAHLLAATLHNDSRHHLKTTRSLDRAMARVPVADAAFSYRAGRMLLAVHRLDDALEQARNACRIAPRDPRYNTLHAAVELAMDRPEAVIHRLGDATRSDLNVEAKLVLAGALVKASKLTRARQLLEEVPAAPTAQRQLTAARLQLAAGQPHQALQELAALKTRPVQSLVLRGLVALRLGDTARAAHWMKTALKRDPLQADGLWALGVVARRHSHASRAIDYLDKAVKANPYHRRARLDLGRLQLQMGRLAAAERQFDALLLLEPGNLPALRGRARGSVEQGSSEAPLYIRALRVRGHSVAAALLEARLQMVQGKLADAAKGFRRLLERRRLERRTEVMLWLAETEHRLGDPARAWALYHRVVARRQPGPAPAARLGLGEISLARDALASALRHGLTAAKELTRGIYTLSLRARIGVHLARCYRGGDALGAAIAELQDVLELDQANLAANLELGLIYGSLNKSDRAVQHLARVLELNGDHAQAHQELSRICRGLSPRPTDCGK